MLFRRVKCFVVVVVVIDVVIVVVVVVTVVVVRGQPGLPKREKGDKQKEI